MKVSSVAVCYERRFNLGDFNSLKLEATIWADLEEGDDHQVVIETLQGHVKEAVRKEYGRLKASVPANTTVVSKSQIAEGTS